MRKRINVKKKVKIENVKVLSLDETESGCKIDKTTTRKSLIKTVKDVSENVKYFSYCRRKHIKRTDYNY